MMDASDLRESSDPLIIRKLLNSSGALCGRQPCILFAPYIDVRGQQTRPVYFQHS